MERSTMPYWVWRCPGCAYVWDPLNEDEVRPDTGAVNALLAEPRYRALASGTDYPEVARNFLCHALLLEQCDSLGDAASAALRAAWACDDGGKTRAAEACRSMVLALWDRASAAGEQIHSPEAECALRADVARRAGDRARARAEAERGLESVEDEVVRAVLTYTLVLLQRGDLDSHTVEAAMEHDASAC